MRIQSHSFPFMIFLFLACFTVPSAWAENEGQADLDHATELKITAEGLPDLNKVIDLLDSAIEKGLDEANTDFAESMLVATLMQRATALSEAVLKQPVLGIRRDARWQKIWQFALTDLQRVIDLDDSVMEAYFLLGRLQSLPSGVPDAARRALTKVIEAEGVEPAKRARAYALRGARQSAPDLQREDFSKAIKLAPDNLEYRLLRARAYQGNKDYVKAMKDIEQALDQAPKNPVVHELKALVLLAQGHLDEALESFNKVSELAPKAVTPYQYRSEVFSRMGDLEQAIEQLDEAIKLQPNNFASLMIRAELNLKTKQPGAALEDVESALRLQPGLLRGHLLRSHVLEQLGRSEEALGALEKLAELAPNQPEVHLQLAVYYVDADQPEDAIDSLNRLLKIDEGNEIALRLRGDMYLAVGKHAEAITDFTEAFAINPDHAGLLNNFAWTLATSPFDQLRDGERAIELAIKACELTDYEAAHIISTLAAAYAETGDFDKAVEWSQKAVAMSEEEIDEQLADELAHYQGGKPWRELRRTYGDSDDSSSLKRQFELEGEPATTLDF